MATMIDSSLWVDYFRPKTPEVIKRQVVEFIDRPDAVLCHPISFEILRAVHRSEKNRVEDVFATLPLLPDPENFWPQAIELGQRCVKSGVHPRSFDLLIAVVCLHHHATLITFDSHFADIGKNCPLQIRLLTRSFN